MLAFGLTINTKERWVANDSVKFSFHLDWIESQKSREVRWSSLLMLTRKVQWCLEIIVDKLFKDIESFVKFQKTNSRVFISPRRLAWSINSAKKQYASFNDVPVNSWSGWKHSEQKQQRCYGVFGSPQAALSLATWLYHRCTEHIRMLPYVLIRKTTYPELASIPIFRKYVHW